MKEFINEDLVYGLLVILCIGLYGKGCLDDNISENIKSEKILDYQIKVALNKDIPLDVLQEEIQHRETKRISK